MIEIIYTLLPIFFLIAIGHILHLMKIFEENFWSGIEHLCYYVMFPSLIIYTLTKTDFSEIPALNLTYTMGGSVALMLIFVSLFYFVAKRFGIDGASYSSIYQGATRWNTFAMLAIIDGFYGDIGLSIAAIGVAVMIPMLNVANVLALALMVGKEPPKFKNIVNLLIKNPFIIACFAGLMINFAGVQLWEPLANLLNLLGRSSLALSLLAVGVGISFAELKHAGVEVIIACILKLGVMPLFMYGLALYFDLSGMSLNIAVLCGAAPTAAASFILARKMGGNSVLMANIISMQTVLSVITIPAILILLGI